MVGGRTVARDVPEGEYPLRARFRRIPDFRDGPLHAGTYDPTAPRFPACFRLASVSTHSGQQVLLRYLHIPYNQKS